MQNIPEMEGSILGLEKLHLTMTIKHAQIRTNVKEQKLITQRKVLDTLLRTVEKRHLPKYYAYETMRRLLLRKKWFYSYRHQIIELIWLLEENNDPRFSKHIEYFCKEINYVKPI